jgi:hypothetical protein
MGTPHRGSAFASWGEVLARLVKTAQFGSAMNVQLLTALRRDSDLLFQISTQFIERAVDKEIVTCYETKPISSLGSLVGSRLRFFYILEARS